MTRVNCTPATDEVAAGEGVDGPSPQCVVTVDPATDAAWAALVTERRSDVFHSPSWMRVLRQTYDFDVRARVLRAAEEHPSAGFAYVALDDIAGARTVSMPFSDFCDPLVDDSEQWMAVAGGLPDDREPLTVKVLFDRTAERDERLAERGTATWHRADVSTPPDELWRRLHPGARRAIRKSQQHGVRIRHGDSLRDVRTFFELHLRVRKRKYRLLAQPWAFFEAIWDHFLEPGRGSLLLAEHDGAVLGGVLFLQWADTLYYKFNASAHASLPMRPNDAVLWAGLQHAHETGLRWLDFGISDSDQHGLVSYKRKYASQEGEVRTLTSMSRPLDRRADARALLPQVTDLFVRPDVPDQVTERAGELLYRYFA